LSSFGILFRAGSPGNANPPMAAAACPVQGLQVLEKLHESFGNTNVAAIAAIWMEP
jgi:hypothetical protein